ncbi:hypothetical protein [Gracilimonas sp.]|uniref:hypothetical protein n=1 Tax=Gracilimonas sp. TaxID=1974203 RepID=UPI0028716407|nr:hypothetical protein [Gracilimonas sp.]
MGVNSFFNEDIPPPSPQSIEHELVVHNSIDKPFKDAKALKTIFQSIPAKGEISKEWLLLFISKANDCSNCLNEVNDYVELSDSLSALKDNSLSLLIYHGVDSLQAVRFAKASDMSNIVDEMAILYTSELSQLELPKLSTNFVNESLLFLIDLKEEVILHVFYLPTGLTTNYSNKEITFRNVIINYTKFK